MNPPPAQAALKQPEHAEKDYFSASLTVPTDRITAIREQLLYTKYSICLERPMLLAQFKRSQQGRRAASDHPLIRRAWAIAYVLSNRKPNIYENELIIGNMTSKRVAANYYPEGGSINILEDLFRLENRQIPLYLSTREKWNLAKIALTTSLSSVGAKTLLRPGRFRHFLDFFRAKRYFITEEAGIAHQVGNYMDVVHHGLCRADQVARKCLQKKTLNDGSPLSVDQEAFFNSVCIVIDGICRMAQNIADAAEEKANAPGLPDARRRELQASAAACRHVPYYPARTFSEGLQACWLVHVAMNLEDFEQGMSFGRLDQILYPLYCGDIETGRLTQVTAAEIMASFQLKTCETMPLYSQRIDQYFSGNAVAQGITVGGTDANGNDVTNELSGLVLDAFAQIRTREPALHVRVHEQTPSWFMEKAVEVLQLGCGKPAFFGDAAVVAALKSAGMTTEHARDYAVIGCVEMASQGRTYNSSDACLFNLPLCLELALNQGRRLMGWNPLRHRFGAETPPVDQMKTFDHVVAAFKRQVEDAVAEMRKVISWLEHTYRNVRPTAINSIMTDGCLDSGKDVTWGGGMYDLTSIQAAGLADAGDSLYAIKRLVFDEGRMSLSQLRDILAANYDGHEPLRRELVNKFPHYGNGNADADAMTQLAADIYADAIRAHKNTRGGRYVPGIYSMTCHIGFGRNTGALPSGRSAGARLSNGLSPIDGLDRSGPTAVLRSAASLDSHKWANCCALNMKFDKKIISGPAGKKSLSGIFRTFFDQGGMQVQANVLDADMLREARKDPKAHPGLVVRVAGYCAYFNDLQPDVQDEIIERTAHGAG